MKRLLVYFISGILLISLISAFYETKQSEQGPESGNLQSYLDYYNKKQPQNNRWIVVLEKDPVLAYKFKASKESALSNSALNSYGISLDKDHNDIKSKLSQKSISIRGEGKQVANFIAIESDNVEIKDIKNINGVKDVFPEPGVYPLLQDTINIVNAVETWSTLSSSGLNVTGQGIKVAVLDSGVDYTHPAFGACTNQQFLSGNCQKIPVGYDTWDNDADPMDNMGHGTHVASIIAGNDVLKGIAPDAKIYAYRVLGGGSSNNLYTGVYSGILEAMDLAMDPNQDGDISDKVDVIHMSLGLLGDPEDLWSQAVNNAFENGVLVTISAGNDGEAGIFTTSGPTNALNAISVGATCKPSQYQTDIECSGAYGLVTDFSSIGPTLLGTQKPDIVAPGNLICAAKSSTFTIGSARYTDCFDNKHVLLSGTSMSGPVAAGVVALMKQAHPTWNVQQIKNTLKGTAVNLNVDPLYQGAGEANALAAAQTSNPYPTAILKDNNRELFIGQGIDILGTAFDSDFFSYKLYYKIGAIPNTNSWVLFKDSSNLIISSVLGYFDASSISEGETISIKLEVADNQGQTSYDYLYLFKRMNSWKEGWPKRIFTDATGMRAPTFFADLDGDGNNEIIAVSVSTFGGKIYVFDSNGNLLSGWPQDIQGGFGNVPAAGDLDGNGDLEIIMRVSGFLTSGETKIYAFNHDGTLVSGWPIDLPYDIVSFQNPVVADLDNDGKDEVIVGAPTTSSDGAIWVLKQNGERIYGDWDYFSSYDVSSSPSVADLNNDGFKEVIFMDYLNDLYIFDYQGSLLPGFPVSLGVNVISSSPVIADFDSDGEKDIGIIYSPNYNTCSFAYYSSKGTLKATLPLGSCESTNDYAISLSRSYLGNTEVLFKNYFSAQLSADINNDDFLDVIYPGFVNGRVNDSFYAGSYYSFMQYGNNHPNWPITLLPNIENLIKTSSSYGGVVGNIDSDEMLEFANVIDTGDMYSSTPLGRKSIGSWVSLVDIGSSGKVFWPMYQHDVGRSGELLDEPLISQVYSGILFRGYLTLKVQKYVKTGDSGVILQSALVPSKSKPSLVTWGWKDQKIVFNSKLTILGPDSFYSMVKNFSDLNISFNSFGKYRIYASLKKQDGSFLKDKYGRTLEKTYEFNIVDKKYECSDGTPWLECNSNKGEFCEFGTLINDLNVASGLCYSTCTNTDGENVTNLGYVYGYDHQFFFKRTDYCEDALSLIEYHCTDFNWWESWYTRYDCRSLGYNTCSNGRCN